MVERENREFGELVNRLVKALVAGVVLLLKFLAIVLLGFLVAIVFIIPWLIRVGGLLVFAYGLYKIVAAVEMIYTAFTPTVPLVALYAFVGIVQLSIFFLLAALDLRLVWGATYFSGASMLWVAQSGIPNIIAHWQYAGLFFRALPPLLFIALVTVETIKAGRRHEGYPSAQHSDILSGAIHNALDLIESIALPNFQSQEESTEESTEGGDAE